MSSQPSATPADLSGLVRACAEAVEELRAARKLIGAQEAEIKILKELNALESQLSDLLKKKDALSAAEIAELHKALEAKDRVIAAVEAQNVILKQKIRKSGWDKLKWAIVGGVAGLVTGLVLAK